MANPTLNRAQRRAAAKAAGVSGQVVSQLVELTDLDEGITTGAVSLAIVAALEGLIAKGGAALEHCVIVVGTDHPDYPNSLVVEAKTDKMMTKSATPLTLGEPLVLPSGGGESQDSSTGGTA